MSSIRRAVVMNDVEGLNKIFSGSELVDTSCYNNVCIKWSIANGYYEITRLLLAYGLTKPLSEDDLYHNLRIAIYNHHDGTAAYVMNYYSIDKSKLMYCRD